jgi:hypothetical protein
LTSSGGNRQIVVGSTIVPAYHNMWNYYARLSMFVSFRFISFRHFGCHYL